MTAKTIINKLGTLILIAMVLGIVVGLVLGETAQIFAPNWRFIHAINQNGRSTYGFLLFDRWCSFTRKL